MRSARAGKVLGDVRSSWSVSVPDRGDYNVAYDVWLDPTPRRDGANTGAELMIWLDRTANSSRRRTAAAGSLSSTRWNRLRATRMTEECSMATALDGRCIEKGSALLDQPGQR